jgi:predicted ATP-grasp superfamily ATP-dependent carboligase
VTAPRNLASYLIVAVSGRALAASAARGGFRVAVLDCFADRDTRSLASTCRSVASPLGPRFDARALLESAETLGRRYRGGLVYGSGFEGRTGLLARVASDRPLHGNPPELVRAVRDPNLFFPLLRRLDISHPEVRLVAPPNPAGWLLKRPGGAGGAHVRHAGDSRPPEDAYFQRFEVGRTLSALFLADGRRARVLGINRQWTAPARPGLRYLYGGAVGGVALRPRIHRELRAGLDALVAATGLVGLNGVDFILRGDRWLVLELNPRPTATMELYDPDYPRGLFRWHLRACRGELPDAAATPRATRAHGVVYARVPCRADPGVRFPRWCRDVPMPGTRFERGDPVCTVHAAAPGAQGAIALLRRRCAQVQRVLQRSAR